MNNDNEPDTRILPPQKLVKSFLLVAGCYIFYLIAMLGTFIAIAKLFFPDVFQNLLEPESVRQLFEADPESVFPKKLFWGWLPVNAFICLCLGWTIARLAPFAKFPHAVFLAVLIFVGCLQQAIPSPKQVTWMFVLMMGVLPISLLFGARLGLSQENSPDEFNSE